MKTYPQTTVRIQDGKSLLDTWKQNFEKLPTIGETLDLDTDGNAKLRGYQDKATVSRIDLDLEGREPVIVLDAVPRKGASARTLVILNVNYVPNSMRREVEEQLRARLELPIFEWQAGNQPRPIIGIHSPSLEIREAADRLNGEIRNLLSGASTLVGIG